jgi:hypothetical protein
MPAPRKYPAELRDRAIRLVTEAREHFGRLAATQDSDGTTTLNVANLHGDLVATIPNQTTGPGTATSSYTETTEYGLQRPNTPTPTARYGWLGTAQRSCSGRQAMAAVGVRAGGIQGPVVKSWWSASNRLMPQRFAVDR